MKKFLVLIVFVLILLPAFAEEEVHKTIDEKLATLRFGTSYEKIGALKFFASFKDDEAFKKRQLKNKILNVLAAKSEDPRVRYQAALTLGSLMQSRLIDRFIIGDSIIPFVKDDDENTHVRAGCVKALGILMKRFPTEPRKELYMAYLRELLKLPSSRNELKIEVLRTICSLGDTAAESALNFALSDSDLMDTAVSCIADLLFSGGNLTSIVIANKLLQVFTNKEAASETRVKAGECLCFMVRLGVKMTSKLDAVTSIVSNPASDAHVTVIACKILYTINNRKSLRPIIDRFADKNLDDATLVKMIQILGDFIRQVSVNADTIKAVNNSLAQFAIFINSMTADENPSYEYSVEVRKVAVFALAQVQTGFNRKGAVILLFGALQDEDKSVREMAYEGLRSMTRQDFGMDEKAWRRWFNKSTFK